MKKLILIIGAPASGKTSVTTKFYTSCMIFNISQWEKNYDNTQNEISQK